MLKLINVFFNFGTNKNFFFLYKLYYFLRHRIKKDLIDKNFNLNLHFIIQIENYINQHKSLFVSLIHHDFQFQLYFHLS